MTQDLADLRQRRAGAQHRRRRRMAQTAGVDPAETGAATGGGHDLRHASAYEGIMGRPDAHKYCPTLGGPETAVAQTSRHRFADVGRQGKVFDAASFAQHEDLAGPPIQVVKLEPGDSPRPQAETNMVRTAKSRQPFDESRSQDVSRR